MGSGGTYIGYLLAKQLGFKYVDREILRLAAQHLKTDTSWLENYDEKSSGLLANILKSLSLGTLEATCVAPLPRPIYDRDLYAVECNIMNDIANQYDAVIMGRGGFHALKNHPGNIRIFIHAPVEFRIQRLMKVWHLKDAKQARNYIDESDQRKSKFIKDIIGLSWTDALNYHLCLDSGKCGLECGTDTIMSFVKHFFA